MTKRNTPWRVDGRRLRQARLERQWTMLDLVKRSGLDVPMISRLEAEKAGNTSIETLGRLCDALDESADWLCGKSRSRKRPRRLPRNRHSRPG